MTSDLKAWAVAIPATYLFNRWHTPVGKPRDDRRDIIKLATEGPGWEIPWLEKLACSAICWSAGYLIGRRIISVWGRRLLTCAMVIDFVTPHEWTLFTVVGTILSRKRGPKWADPMVRPFIAPYLHGFLFALWMNRGLEASVVEEMLVYQAELVCESVELLLGDR